MTKSLVRQKLSETRQGESESIDEFIVRLQELSIDYQYDAAVLTKRLREHFINGVRPDPLKRKLLEAEDENIDELLRKARTFEQVDWDVWSSSHAGSAEIAASTTSEAYFVKQPRTSSTSTRKNQIARGCFRCGEKNHDLTKCWYLDQTCNYCQKINHKAKVCFKAARDRARKQVGNQQFNRHETHAGKIGNQQQLQQQPNGQKRNGSMQH